MEEKNHWKVKDKFGHILKVNNIVVYPTKEKLPSLRLGKIKGFGCDERYPELVYVFLTNENGNTVRIRFTNNILVIDNIYDENKPIYTGGQPHSNAAGCVCEVIDINWEKKTFKKRLIREKD